MSDFNAVLAAPKNLLILHEDEGIAVYLLCNMYAVMSKGVVDELPIHTNDVTYALYGSLKNTAKIDKIMDKLAKANYFKKIAHGTFLIKFDDFIIKNDQFLTIRMSDFKTILDSDKNSRFTILKHYFYLLMSLDYNIEINGRRNIVGHMPLSYFANIYNCSTKTITLYNRELESMNLIEFRHRGMVDGDPQTNVYARYEDAELLDLFCGDSNCDSDLANKHRMITQKYNHYIKTGGAGYTAAETAELYKMCVEFNEDMDRMQQKQPGSDYVKRKKLLTQIKTDSII